MSLSTSCSPFRSSGLSLLRSRFFNSRIFSIACFITGCNRPQFSEPLPEMLGRDELEPVGIEDSAASGPELVAWALVSPPLTGSAG